jgi:hypothetical protein
MAPITLERARAAKRAALREFGRIGHVVGVGITRIEGEYAVKINLREPLDPNTQLPTEIDGVAIRIEITGSIRRR